MNKLSLNGAVCPAIRWWLETPATLVNQIAPPRTPRKMPRGELSERERIDRSLLCLLWCELDVAVISNLVEAAPKRHPTRSTICRHVLPSLLLQSFIVTNFSMDYSMRVSVIRYDRSALIKHGYSEMAKPIIFQISLA